VGEKGLTWQYAALWVMHGGVCCEGLAMKLKIAKCSLLGLMGGRELRKLAGGAVS